MEALTMKCSGIKCDNPKCDYRDDTVSFEDYINWVNKPCPKCGSNLLTQKDYYNCVFLAKFSNVVNKIFPKVKDNEEVVTIKIQMDGSGDMKITPKK